MMTISCASCIIRPPCQMWSSTQSTACTNELKREARRSRLRLAQNKQGEGLEGYPSIFGMDHRTDVEQGTLGSLHFLFLSHVQTKAPLRVESRSHYLSKHSCWVPLSGYVVLRKMLSLDGQASIYSRSNPSISNADARSVVPARGAAGL